MDPALILDDKSKEKTLTKEMNNKYGTDRGTRGIIIKRINNVATQFSVKILACKLLQKCRKDKVPEGVIVIASQCTEGTLMTWAPYLSYLFQVDCKDAQDASKKFHYSWLITLIAFMGWREPKYVVFGTTPQSGGEIYCILIYVPLAKNKKGNGIVFEAYLQEIQEAISRAWRIALEAVA
jgi:hypothetical protein